MASRMRAWIYGFACVSGANFCFRVHQLTEISKGPTHAHGHRGLISPWTCGIEFAALDEIVHSTFDLCAISAP